MSHDAQAIAGTVEFDAESKLPSCHVSKELLEELERYILDQSRQIGYSEDEISKAYWVTLQFATGTETLRRVAQYRQGVFSDDIKSASLVVGLHADRGLQIAVAFGTGDTGSYSTKARVKLKGPNARETAEGIVQGIESIVGSRKNINGLFHWGAGFPAAFLLAVLITVAPALVLRRKAIIPKELTYYFVLMLMMLVTSVLGAFLPKLRPYAEFETNLNKTRRRVLGWVAGGIAAFLLFTVLLEYGLLRWLGMM